MIKKLLLISVAVILLSGLFFACTKTTPTGSTPTSSATTAPVAVGTKLYTGIYTYRDTAFQEDAQRFVDELKAMTNGQLVLTPKLESSLGNMEEGLQNLGQGLFQCGGLAQGYSSGLDPALLFAGASNFEMIYKNIYDYVTLEFKYGIADVYQREVYDKLNVRMIWPIPMPTETIVSTYPIKSPDDLKNHKFRSFGSAAKTLEAFGAQTVWFPGSEIYSSLASGVIDGATYESHSIMYKLGIQEVAKYWTNQSITIFGATYRYVNKDWWSSLPAHLQQCFIIASANAGYRNYFELTQKDDEARMAVAKAGVTLSQWSDKDIDRWSNTYFKVTCSDMIKNNTTVAKCWEILKRYFTDEGRPIPQF
jgi:TRAP-type C4-dicarboxylate transport system substrate-binding protein